MGPNSRKVLRTRLKIIRGLQHRRNPLFKNDQQSRSWFPYQGSTFRIPFFFLLLDSFLPLASGFLESPAAFESSALAPSAFWELPVADPSVLPSGDSAAVPFAVGVVAPEALGSTPAGLVAFPSEG